MPAAFRLGLGQCQTDMKKFDEAQANLLAALPVLEAKLGKPHPYTVRTREALVELYTAWSRPEDAAKYSAKPQ
jgi:hypothetical protein